MNTTLIVLVIAIVAVAAVVWFTRKRPAATTARVDEADTAWNDPVSPDANPAARTNEPRVP
jgi:NADH:ubiquinone oxidoreductase subunit H